MLWEMKHDFSDLNIEANVPAPRNVVTTALTHPLSPTADLARFIATGAEATGFLKGEIGAPPPGWYVAGEDNSAALHRLHQALVERYPEAGKAFWAVRVWTNLVWQPAYLAVLGVHLSGGVPDLSRMAQGVEGIHVDHYRLPAVSLRHASLEALIGLVGAELRSMTDTMLEEINSFTRLKPVPARRLLADRMLGVIVKLSHLRRDIPAETIHDYCRQWLAAMGLTGEGTLETLRLHDGRQAVIIARKGCCLDYLIEPGVYCTSCPKQDDALRLRRQRAVAEEALGA